MKTKTTGLFKKYHITKMDGSPMNPDAVYFVLRLDTDPHAEKAVKTYATSVEEENPELASDLLYMLENKSWEAFRQYNPSPITDLDRRW